MKLRILILFWFLAVSGMVYMAMEKSKWLAEEPERARQSPFQALFNPLELGEDAAPEVKKAIVATDALSQALTLQLESALSGGNVEGAMQVCGAVAQEMTSAIGKSQGVFLKRSALKLRNIQNQADPFERAWMNSQAIFTSDYPARPHGERVDGPGGEREYRRITPIYMRSSCLPCHGNSEKIDRNVLEYLRKNYPDDAAVGFSEGEFRGIISVRVPL